MKIVTSEQMKLNETLAMDKYAIPSLILMEQAGTSIAQVIRSHYKTNHKILIVCGKGNNGGDGFVVARLLHYAGYMVHVQCLWSSEDFAKDALVNYEMVAKLGLIIDMTVNYADYDVIVDAVFGTGLTSNLRDLPLSVIQKINACSAEVIAIDIPSGISGTSGHVMGEGIQATHTVVLDHPKWGNLLYPGACYNGQLHVVKIGIPESCFKETAYWMTDELMKKFFLQSKDNIHKGHMGKVMMYAGSEEMAGAAMLSSYAAMRTGTGLLKLYVPKSINGSIKSFVPEVMTVFDYKKEDLNWADVVAIGPGLGLQKDLIKNIMEGLSCPIVIDADGLNVISEHIEWLDGIKDCIITPHLGEMSKLTGLSVDVIEKDMVGIALEYAKLWQCVIVLKSARTVIATPQGHVYLNTFGNAGMATAGSGDVLTGIIASFLGQGCSCEHAAVLGVHVHAKAGDLAKERFGIKSLIARDIANQIAEVLKSS